MQRPFLAPFVDATLNSMLESRCKPVHVSGTRARRLITAAINALQ